MYIYTESRDKPVTTKDINEVLKRLHGKGYTGKYAMVCQVLEMIVGEAQSRDNTSVEVCS